MSETAPAASLEATKSRRGERAGHRIFNVLGRPLAAELENPSLTRERRLLRSPSKAKGRGYNEVGRGKPDWTPDREIKWAAGFLACGPERFFSIEA